MSKILVKDLRGLVTKTEYIEKIEFKGLNIELKTCLPIKEKLVIANNVYNSSLDDIDGFEAVDMTSENISLVYFIIDAYTNITLPKCVFESFDMITSTGIFNEISKIIAQEIKTIIELVDNLKQKNKEIQLQKNSIGGLLKNLPEGLSHIVEVAKSIDPKLIENYQEISKKISEQ